jgi:hypothetical protein
MGIHIDTIMSIFIAHILMPKMVNFMCILNGVIGMSMWISLMKVLKS